MLETNQNLEGLIAKVSFELVNEGILDENLINKLLGVLSHHGVYAMWLLAKSELKITFSEDKNEQYQTRLWKFLEKIGKVEPFKELNLNQLTNNICRLTREIKRTNNSPERKEKERERNQKLDEFFINISEDLNNLLFAKTVLEKLLTYARYHAKAMGRIGGEENG